MWYIKICLICLIINLIADIIVNHYEPNVNTSLINITVLTFIPLINIGFTLVSLLVIIVTPIAKLTERGDEE